MMYKALATQTMASAQKGEFAGPLVFIVVGALLIYVPSTLNTSLSTIFGSTDIGTSSQLIGYSSMSSVEQWQEITDVIVQYMYLVGLIAFVRGWVILSKMGHSGSQPGSVGKGLIHVIGGILLINIVDTVNLLASTFGYTG
jgi:intracellular multiplication protein IcmC